MSEPDWTPRREGNTYCSPACGGGCTLEAYRKAEHEAIALASRLGPNWKPVVWENLGWHYKVVLRPGSEAMLAVYPERGGQYWIDSRLLGSQYNLHHSDPVQGVRDLLTNAEAEAHRTLEACKFLREAAS